MSAIESNLPLFDYSLADLIDSQQYEGSYMGASLDGLRTPSSSAHSIRSGSPVALTPFSGPSFGVDPVVLQNHSDFDLDLDLNALRDWDLSIGACAMSPFDSLISDDPAASAKRQQQECEFESQFLLPSMLPTSSSRDPYQSNINSFGQLRQRSYPGPVGSESVSQQGVRSYSLEDSHPRSESMSWAPMTMSTVDSPVQQSYGIQASSGASDWTGAASSTTSYSLTGYAPSYSPSSFFPPALEEFNYRHGGSEKGSHRHSHSVDPYDRTTSSYGTYTPLPSATSETSTRKNRQTRAEIDDDTTTSRRTSGATASTDLTPEANREKNRCFEHGCNGRQFSTFSNLLRHQREREGTSSKSACPHCGVEFTRTTARNSHLRHGKCRDRRRAQMQHEHV